MQQKGSQVLVPSFILSSHLYILCGHRSIHCRDYQTHLSYRAQLMETFLALQITKDSFLAIMKLPNLQVLTLVGCIGIDDDALGSLDKECCKSLQVCA